MIPSEIRIVDLNGAEQDAAWAAAKYGAVGVTRAAAPTGAAVYRVVELQEKEGPAVLVATLRDGDNHPISGVRVVRYWPGAPMLPEWESPPERYFDRGVYDKTNQEGAIGYGMGQGDYYNPATQKGASGIWVATPSTHSDLVDGLGMLPGTVHEHFDAIFELTEGSGPGPGPGPSGGFYAEVGAGLAEMAGGLARIGAAVASLDQS